MALRLNDTGLHKAVRRDKKYRKRRKSQMVVSGRSVFLLDYLIRKKIVDDMEGVPADMPPVREASHSGQLSDNWRAGQ